MYTQEHLLTILNKLLKLSGESELVEFKKAENSFSDSDLGEYFSALSNEANLKGVSCAWLVFGVDDKTHQVQGTNYKPSKLALDAMKKKIGDQTTNRITFEEIHEIEYKGHRVVMFEIPAAPHGIPVAYKGHYYGRDGSSLVALNIVEIERIRNQGMDASFEMRLAKDNLSAGEVLELLNFKKLYELIDRHVPKDTSMVLDLMKEYGLVVNGKCGWSITNMGALLFANRLSDFDSVRAREIILRRYEGSNNRLLSAEKKSVSGYVIEFEDFLDWLEMNTSKERITTLREREVTYPKVAIREFLANMMVHQDFDVKGMPLTIEIFGNRMVFTNPGDSLNDINRLIDLPPRSRNEKLAEMLLLLKICERRGSGYDRAVEAIESMNLPPYKVESGKSFTRLTMFPQKALKDMTQSEKVQACYQHACLLYEENAELNNASLRKRLELGDKQSSVASRIITDTLNAGLIKPANEDIHSRKFATYVPFYG